MRLELLVKSQNLSIRAFKICLENNIFTTTVLRQYYNSNETFVDLTGCGKITDQELFNTYNRFGNVVARRPLSESFSL
ncbi:MAG: hypothetical protein WBG43_10355 [Marinifilaceae bacterium]